MNNLKPVSLLLLAAGAIATALPAQAMNAASAPAQISAVSKSAQPLNLDTPQLLSMTPGAVTYFNLPAIGNYPIVFEHTTGTVNGVA